MLFITSMAPNRRKQELRGRESDGMASDIGPGVAPRILFARPDSISAERPDCSYCIAKQTGAGHRSIREPQLDSRVDRNGSRYVYTVDTPQRRFS